MERRAPNGAHAPDPNAWREHAAIISGCSIAYEHGAVQFVGRAPLDIRDAVITVPFAQLFMIVGQLLGALDPSHPAHAAVRASLFPSRIAPP